MPGQRRLTPRAARAAVVVIGQIEDQAIIKAFGDEPACSDLVRVFGG